MIAISPSLRFWMEGRLAMIGWSIWPRDRILSATSEDGEEWRRETGVRIDIGGPHLNECVYHPCVVALKSGLWRMYFSGSTLRNRRWNCRILSAVSDDGLAWSQEPGIRISHGNGFSQVTSPTVIERGKGWLAYYVGIGVQGESTVLSGTSVDGLSFIPDPHFRINASLFPNIKNIIGCFALKLDSGIRLFLSTLTMDGKEQIVSLFSANERVFDPEPGVRLGLGVPGVKAHALSPVVTLVPGGFKMYFQGGERRAIGNRVYAATSSDGMNWNVTRECLFPRKDHPYEGDGVEFPYVVKTNVGWRMYYVGFFGSHLTRCRTMKRWDSLTEQIWPS